MIRVKIDSIPRCPRKWLRLCISVALLFLVFSFLSFCIAVSRLRPDSPHRLADPTRRSPQSQHESKENCGQNGELCFPALFGQRYFSARVLDNERSVVIYSAYVDFRDGNMGKAPSVRLMALAKTDDHAQLQCRFSSPTGETKTILATWYATPEPHDAAYAAYVVSCAIPIDTIETIDDLKEISICAAPECKETFTIPISNRVIDSPNATETNIDHRRQHTVCVPTLYGDRYSQQHLIEFIEATRILGADYFFLYINDDDFDNYKRVLESYRILDQLTYFKLVLPVGNDIRQIWNYAQSLVIEDCIFRNAGYSRYVVLNDIDEYFVPYAAETWSELSSDFLWKEPHRAGYALQTYYFRFGANGENILPPAPLTLKLSMASTNADRLLTKCIVRPERVFDQGIHHVSRVIQDFYLVTPMDSEIAALHHFKNVFELSASSERTRLKQLMEKGNFEKEYKFAGRFFDNNDKSASWTF